MRSQTELTLKCACRKVSCQTVSGVLQDPTYILDLHYRNDIKVHFLSCFPTVLDNVELVLSYQDGWKGHCLAPIGFTAIALSVALK